MKVFFFLALPCALFAQPQWTSIAKPGNAYQYFLYARDQRIENSDWEAKNPHPAPDFIYHFPDGGATRSVCQLNDRADVYWFSPDGHHLDGTFTTTNPTEFNVSVLEEGIRGIGATAEFAGSAEHAGALEVLYFTDRACSDAGVEYGLTRDLATDSLLVYWSTYANCSNDAASLCRKTNDAALGQNFSNVRQENGGTHIDHGFRIYGLDLNAAYTYKMFVEDHAFHIEVWNGPKLVECSGSPDGVRSPCWVVRYVQPWFPIDQLHSGYVVVGTQNTDGSGVAKDAAFKVSDILVLK